MGRRHLSLRLEDSVVDGVDAWAEAHGTTRTAAVEALVSCALRHGEGAEEVPPRGHQKAPEGVEGGAGTDGASDGLRAVVGVLRASNADLRAEVSRLWAQVAEKDEQIRSLTGIADHAQKLHAAEVTRALPQAEVRPSLWERITGRRKD